MGIWQAPEFKGFTECEKKRTKMAFFNLCGFWRFFVNGSKLAPVDPNWGCFQLSSFWKMFDKNVQSVVSPNQNDEQFCEIVTLLCFILCCSTGHIFLGAVHKQQGERGQKLPTNSNKKLPIWGRGVSKTQKNCRRCLWMVTYIIVHDLHRNSICNFKGVVYNY